MPFMIKNRSFFNTFYHIDGSEPGEYQFIVSGVGNEDVIKKYGHLAGKDVIGCIQMNYWSVTPARDHRGRVIGTNL